MERIVSQRRNRVARRVAGQRRQWPSPVVTSAPVQSHVESTVVSTPPPGRNRHRNPAAIARFVGETLLAVMLTVVVYVQTDRIAHLSASQSENLMLWGEVSENQRFVREAVMSNSPVMSFSNLDLRYARLRGLHFGCTDSERKRAQGEKDSGWSPTYVGMNCKADFSESNLTRSDFQGSQLRSAVFEHANLYEANLALTNLIFASFSDANLRFANLDYAWANHARFESTTLAGSNIRKAHLVKAEFVDANLDSVDFQGSDLTDATFTRVQCSGTLWPARFEPPSGCDD